MDLSKAFDTLPHGLIVLKSKQCQVDDKIITLIKDYLFNRRQRVKLGNVILHDRIQRLELPKYPSISILGPVLFNIFMNDLAYVIKRRNIYISVDLCR